jgi:UDP-2-acetamido-3-amino-2,3-dideoxy-glucuronate N-acetyltransferase
VGATLGANATIICGNTIGRYAFIGAGAVVTADVPDYALIMGNPGRIGGWMCACGTSLDFESNKSQCHRCGNCYVKDGNSVSPSHEAEKQLDEPEQKHIPQQTYV